MAGITGATAGVLGWSSRGDLAKEVAEAKAAQAVYLDKLAATDVTEISAGSRAAAVRHRRRRIDLQGLLRAVPRFRRAGRSGYPNLNDDAWIWGGTIEEMPAFGDILEAEQINQVAAYVVSLSDTPSDPAMVEPGKVVFAENCAACHGENAEGIPDFGAPRLSDGIWLKGSTEAQIVQQIRNPKHGVMPAWVDRLGEPTIKQLAVFVHTLGGGQ
jgi:cytochrome c oxidase cbb3-type subunit 3